METTIPDVVNGLFEAFGSLAIMFSIRKLWQDKKVHGYSWYTLAFFTFWGAWNLYFYHHLDQMFSWLAGMAVFGTNITYLTMLIYYIKNPGGKQARTKEQSLLENAAYLR